MRTIYLDESEFSPPNNYIGYGALVVDNKLTDQLIINAINSLKQDKDSYNNNLDQRTISKNYFHASADSKNGHSHLCRQISKYIDGEFYSNYFDLKIMKQKKYDSNILLKLSSKLSSMKALNTINEVDIIFERRDGLSNESLNRWLEELENDLILTTYDQPYMPNYFPKVNLIISDKNNPGIQCCDFVLWAVNRFVNNDSTWIDRLDYRVYWFCDMKDGGYDFSISLNKGINDIVYNYSKSDIPKNPDNLVNHEMLIKFYLYANKIIEYYSINNIPSSIKHFRMNIIKLYQNRNNIQFHNYIDNLSRIYLKLFDMVPLIDGNTTKEDKEFLLLSKKYLGLTLRHELINGVRTNHYLTKCRLNQIQNNINQE